MSIDSYSLATFIEYKGHAFMHSYNYSEAKQFHFNVTVYKKRLKVHVFHYWINHGTPKILLCIIMRRYDHLQFICHQYTKTNCSNH